MENKDITIEIEKNVLNIRAAVIINHENKVLMHRDTLSDHYALLGGRVKLGENSSETVKREVKEEIGKEIEIKGYISTIENFFNMKNKKYHEILFVYQGEFTSEQDKKITETLKNIEGEKELQYEWIKIDELNKYPIKPESIIEVLQKQKYPVHVINDDINKKKEMI